MHPQLRWPLPSARRGVVEVPAVAIFTIIAGSLIVLFFVIMTQSSGKGAEAELQARSLQFIDTLLKGAATTARPTLNNITVVDDTLLFRCEEGEMSFGYQALDGKDLKYTDIVLFSPRTLGGGKVLAYTVPSAIPYRTTNVLYLTSPSTIYSVDVWPDDPAVTYGLDMAGFPRNVLYEPLLFDINGAPLRKKDRIMVLDGDRYGPPAALSNAANLLAVYQETGKPYGSVVYHAAAGQPLRTVIYPNQELLWGAVLSRDADTYTCVMDTYLSQVRFVNAIQRNRVARLKAEAFAADSSCYDKYALFPFDEINQSASVPAADWTVAEAALLETARKEIEFMNQNLLLGEGCESVY